MDNVDETKPKTKSIRVVKMAELHTDYPIVSEGRKWVNYGEGNEYPEYLLDLFLYSPTNSAVIGATSQMIVGSGLQVENQEGNPIAANAVSNYFSLKKLKKLAFNLKTYGFSIIKLNIGSQLISVSVEDSNHWRSGVKDEFGNVLHWFKTENWENANGKHRPEPYPVFTPSARNGVFVYVISLPLFGLPYYPPVDYTGGVASIQLEAEIAEYHLSAIQNGLAPGTIFNFNSGVPPDAEQDAIESDVKRKFSGAGNSGKFLLSFNESSDNATTVETLEISKIDKQYEFLSKETTSKVMLAHRVTTPLLFGIRDSSGLGNNAEELKDSYILYYETVIKGYQDIILAAIAEILFINKVSSTLVFGEYMPFKKEKETEKASGETKLSEIVEFSEVNLLTHMKRFKLSNVKLDTNYVLTSEKVAGKDAPTNGGKIAKFFELKSIKHKHTDVLLQYVTELKGVYTFEDMKKLPKIKDTYWVEKTYLIKK